MSNWLTTKNHDKLNVTNYNEDNIYLFYQFFIHSDKERYNEIKFCFKKNIEIGLFTKIILFNERIYSNQELGLNEKEMLMIQQIDIGKRLKFNDCFNEIHKLKLQGYFVISNSDIFFDKTLINIRKSCLSETKSMYMLLRFEYLKQKKLGYCKLFTYQNTNTPRSDSQDTWIYHSNYNPESDIIDKCNFSFGQPGCDNKITLIMTQSGYICYNEPWNIKTYHNHNTQIRNYTIKDLVQPPWLKLEPCL